MIATIRKRSQITLPSEIITKLGLNEGDQLDVREQDGTIVLFPMSVYPTKYIEWRSSMAYRITYTKRFEKHYKKMTPVEKKQIKSKVGILAENPLHS